MPALPICTVASLCICFFPQIYEGMIDNVCVVKTHDMVSRYGKNCESWNGMTNVWKHNSARCLGLGKGMNTFPTFFATSFHMRGDAYYLYVYYFRLKICFAFLVTLLLLLSRSEKIFSSLLWEHQLLSTSYQAPLLFSVFVCVWIMTL